MPQQAEEPQGTERLGCGAGGRATRGVFSEWERLCCVKRSMREGGLAGPRGLAEEREGERVGVPEGGFVRGFHTEVRRESLNFRFAHRGHRFTPRAIWQ